MESVSLCTENVQDVLVVVFPGESLDASNSGELRIELDPLLESHQKVVFDLSRLRFVDSSGCGVLLSCLRGVNAAGGDLKLCNVAKPVQALFELIRLHRIMDIVPNREDAINAFND
ncbi:MAG: STAS domain-containing protein [Planctomycetes bacterium]|nr:STAS domain-containing protein [Planctomycetota bacterium]